MRIFTSPIKIVFALSLLVFAVLPATAGQVVHTAHPLPGVPHARMPGAVVQASPGQISPHGSDRLQYMQAYREAMKACVRQTFPTYDPRNMRPAPDDEITSNRQAQVNSCLSAKGLSTGPGAVNNKAVNNAVQRYMTGAQGKAQLNMLKQFDKVYAEKRKNYAARGISPAPIPENLQVDRTKLVVLRTAAASAQHPAGEEDVAPVIYVTPRTTGAPAAVPHEGEPEPEVHLWVTPRSQ